MLLIKLPIPIMHRHFFRVFSQSHKYREIHCNQLNNPFLFACRRWMVGQKFEKKRGKKLFSEILPLNSLFQDLSNNI